MIILKTLHSALSVSVVANAPAPAISGKITGTIVAEPSGPLLLYRYNNWIYMFQLNNISYEKIGVVYDGSYAVVYYC